MITVDKATSIVLRHKIKLDSSRIDYMYSLGKILDEPVLADRDIPAFNRATMDGIAIRHKDFAGNRRSFKIVGIQAAGALPTKIGKAGECLQIMTGASLDKTVDTVVRIEDVLIKGNLAAITVENISKGQFVHVKGSDKKQNSLLASPGQVITADLLATMASVGKTSIRVVSPPKIAIITSGDELVEPGKDVFDEYKIRRSNDLAVYGLLHRYGVETKMIHVNDDEKIIMQNIMKSLKTFDAVITIGGVSRGKYDYVQTALAKLGATKHFHGVEQKPGKPLWFGSLNDKPVFGLPGNPVSVYISMVRYVIPWLEVSLGINQRPIVKAMLDQDLAINPGLTDFILVKTYLDDRACLRAKPVANNNSGDFTSISTADAFLELPAGRTLHKQNGLYRLWPYKNEIM